MANPRRPLPRKLLRRDRSLEMKCEAWLHRVKEQKELAREMMEVVREMSRRATQMRNSCDLFLP